MAITNHTWLYRNDLRNYPLSDRAEPDHTGAVVDFHISLPDTLPFARVYISRLIVSQGLARATIELEGHGVLAEVATQLTEPYRANAFASDDGTVKGFICFGTVADNNTLSVDQTLTADQGEVLESLVYRYPVSSVSGLGAGGTLLGGNVSIAGDSGVVVEVQDVYYTEEQASYPSVVIRLERDIDTMVEPVPECHRHLESGLVTGVVTSINGVRPDGQSSLIISLESALLDTGLDEDDNSDGSTSSVSSDSRYVPFLEFVQSLDHVVGLKDNYNYQASCANNNRNQTIVYGGNRCLLCVPSDDGAAEGHDAAGGYPITFAGCLIYKTTLYVFWHFYGTGNMLAGPNIDNILVDIVGTGQVEAPGGVVTQGSSPVLPGSLIPCERQHSTPGSLGEIGICRYELPVELASGTRFSLSIPAGSVIDQRIPTPLGNLSVETCLYTAQASDEMSVEETQFLEENCF